MSKKRKRKCARCDKWCDVAAKIAEKYDAMGLRHDASRAQGAKDVLIAMGCEFTPGSAHSVTHVAGLTRVDET